MTEMKRHFLESGIILVNKPVGFSSNKVVNIVKHHLGAKKCGHLGTLDLEGAGLLPVTVNAATKLFDLFLQKDKTYQATFEFGVETDTLDLAGEVTKRCECNITRAQVEGVCKKMLGKSLQMPPMYSAKKVGGKVAYKEARKGNVLDLKPKEIEIFSIKVLGQKEKNVYNFEISCSSGTYIRCIARDMAKLLSTYGIMHCILRTRCGGFYLKDACTLEELENGKFNLLKCEDVLDFNKIFLDKSQEEKLLFGQAIDTEKADGKYRIFGEKFLGVGKTFQGKLKLDIRLF